MVFFAEKSVDFDLDSLTTEVSKIVQKLVNFARREKDENRVRRGPDGSVKTRD